MLIGFGFFISQNAMWRRGLLKNSSIPDHWNVVKNKINPNSNLK